LAGLVNFRLAFDNYRNGVLPICPSSAPPPNHLVPVFSCEKALNIKKIKIKIKIEGLGLGWDIGMLMSTPMNVPTSGNMLIKYAYDHTGNQ
jgi:hypothetical protein